MENGDLPHDLSGAYALDGPEACARLYAGWAETYDHDFARDMDYRLPAEVAAAFLRADPPEGPVLDVGAGTGLVGLALRGLGFQGPMDAFDLSEEMLEKAAAKGIYRAFLQGDVNRPPALVTRYAGILSSGTFTHGHVGPAALAPLLRLAAPGAVVALSVNAGVWEAQGFAETLAALPIHGLDRADVAIYGAAAQHKDPAHADDRALIVTFRSP